MTYASRYIVLAFIAIAFTCCQRKQEQPKLPPDTTRQGNIYTTHSRDTARLSKLVNLRLYKPHAVEFHYTYIDNSGGDNFLSVPSPSDSYLEAVLYFDSATYSQLLKVCSDPPQESPTVNRVSKGDFVFNWLPAGVTEELLKSDSSYHNYTCAPFHRTALWLLDKKVLLRKESI
jgi:hypothetical protein